MKKHILFYKNSVGEVTSAKCGQKHELREEALKLTAKNDTDNVGAYIIDANKFDSFLVLAKKTVEVKTSKKK